MTTRGLLVIIGAVLLCSVAAAAQDDPAGAERALVALVDVARAGAAAKTLPAEPHTSCFAGTVTCGQTVTGRVSVDSCESDFVYGVGYLFNGTMGQVVTLRASSPSFRMTVGLADGRSGNSTIYATNQAGTSGGIAQITNFSLPFTGPYLIILSPLVTFTFGDYSLTVTCSTTTPPPSSSCTETMTTMCLNSGRFKVEATWQSSDGKSGAASAVRMTADTGYLWFFSNNNVEVVVKVLNACNPFGRYWVFAGGLTDVGVDLVVTDTRNGAVRRYANPLNTPFQPVQDTSAFATCP